MPEWALLDHLRQLPRLEAAERFALQSALLYTAGRQLSEQDRRGYERELQRAYDGEQQRRRVPKIKPEQLRALGFHIRPGKEVSEES